MPKFMDLTGKRFGKLDVWGKHANQKEVRWLCVCDCGRIKSVVTHSLVDRRTTSCGCQKNVKFLIHGLSNTRLYRLWNLAKKRARAKNIPFNIHPKDLMLPERCPVLDIPLAWTDGHQTDCTPSLDRIIPKLGYVKGNIQIISYRANTIKSNATVQELEKVLNYVRDVCPPDINRDETP